MAAKKKKSARKAVKKTARKAAAKKIKPRKQPETLRLRSISPGFTVNDLQASLHFYSHVLGFVIGEKWEQDGKLMGAEIKAGTTTMWLGQDDFAKGRDRTKGIGVRLYCATKQNIDTLANGIKTRGGKLDHEPITQSWGTRDFSVTDPDGYKISIQTAR